MTLLAAFTIHDIPILIGDFLLTDEQVMHIIYFIRLDQNLRALNLVPEIEEYAD